MNKNVPRLRFKEFNDEWKIDKLDENTYIKGRIGWKNLKQEEYTEEGPYLIAGKHINNGIINWEKCDHILDERYEESLEIALQNGDIIFSKDGSLGNPALIESLKEKATINGTMMLIRLDKAKYSSKYFYQVLQSVYFKKLIRNVKSGSSIPHIFQRDMIDFKFPITSLQEQEKIADFFTILDSLIEEQDGKVSDLELYKKGMMQKIFSQEIRFKDENGCDYPAWEEKLLSNIANVLSGKRVPKGESLSNDKNGIKYITVSDMGEKYVSDEKVRYITSIIEEKIKKYKVYTNDLIISVAGTLGKINIIDKVFNGANLTENCDKITNFKECSYKYIYYYLNTDMIQNQINSANTISSQPKLALERIRNFDILVPYLEEQNKIVSFLSNIDNLIEEEKKNLDDLKEMKKGLLQQMFV